MREAARLRDARRAFTAQLGFLPVSASLVVGLFAALREDVDERWLAIALIPFVLSVAIGALFSRRAPYRTIRADVERRERVDWLSLSPEEWLRTRIRHEELIYAKLAEGLVWERWGVHVVQALVVAQILYVIVLTLL